MDIGFAYNAVKLPATQIESNMQPKGSHHHSILLSIT